MRSILSVKKILNNLVLKQENGREYFISTPDSIIISIPKLATILKFLVINNFISIKVLEVVVDEYYMYKETQDGNQIY